MSSFKTIILISILFVFASCAKSIPQKLDDFVDEVEQNASSFTESDWEEASTQYEQLVNEYLTSDKEYTDEQKELAAKAMGRYHALLVKNGIEKSASFLKELGVIVPSYLDGLLEGLDEYSDDIEEAVNKLFDEEKIEKTLESLGEKLDGLFGGTKD